MGNRSLPRDSSIHFLHSAIGGIISSSIRTLLCVSGLVSTSSVPVHSSCSRAHNAPEPVRNSNAAGATHASPALCHTNSRTMLEYALNPLLLWKCLSSPVDKYVSTSTRPCGRSR